MATSSLIFSSSSNEQRWVNQISETLDQKDDTIINIDVCIFKLSKTLTDSKPEVYAPKQIGLGPYHHLRPDLHKTERRKLAAAKRILKAIPTENPMELLIEMIKKDELRIRALYDQYIDLDGDTLAWVFAIDGLWLFDHLKEHYSQQTVKKFDGTRESAQDTMAEDILMLENQLPSSLLKLIGRFLRKRTHYSIDESESEEPEEIEELGIPRLRSNFSVAHFPLDEFEIEESLFEFSVAHSPLDKFEIEESLFEFSLAHSPLELKHMAGLRPVHVLDFMYKLIVLNQEYLGTIPCANILKESAIDDGIKVAKNINDGLTILGAPQSVRMPFQLIQTLPWHEILDLFKRSDQTESSVEEIMIPSASQLHSIAKINFSKISGGIRDIKFNPEKRTIDLPLIKLHRHSEVILRNLLAYEASKGFSTLELAEYVDLMCGIVDTVEDVELLAKAGIIEKDGVSDEQVAKLFNGISKSSGGGKLEKEVIEKVNEEFEKQGRIKAYKLMKKYGIILWKVLKVGSVVLLVLLYILQSVCQIYGCSTRFFGDQKALYVPMAYGDS